MARPAHPHAMAPHRPGRTRTAPPQMPATWWGSKRILTYLLFDATGVVYFLVSFVAIGLVQALQRGPESWDAAMTRLQNPLYIAFHLLCLVSVVFVAVRFFRLFPKAQPKAIGPMKPPPGPVIHVALYVVWFAITVFMTAVLAGVIL
jgi:fumarate reductase subunit C